MFPITSVIATKTQQITVFMFVLSFIGLCNIVITRRSSEIGSGIKNLFTWPTRPIAV